MSLNIVIFGPPGSGKGTQAEKLAKKYQLVHISTGDLFRQELKSESDLGKKVKSLLEKGELVPDEITIQILKNKVEANSDSAGFIFDGFPRTIPQAEALDSLLNEKGSEVTVLLSLKVTDEEIVKRLLERGKISGRTDDSDESVIRNRIQVYNEETKPVFDYYADQGKAEIVNGIGSIEEIFHRLCDEVEEKTH